MDFINLTYHIQMMTIGIEAVGKKYRVVCGFIYQIITSIGSISLGFVAYYVRDWRSLQLIIGAPMFLLLFIPLWDISLNFPIWFRLVTLMHRLNQ